MDGFEIKGREIKGVTALDDVFAGLNVQTGADAQAGAADENAPDALQGKMEEKMAQLARTVQTLDRRVAEVVGAARRPLLAATPGTAMGEIKSGRMEDTHRAAFTDRYLRKGLETGLAGLEAKSLNISTPGDGGYAVPEAIDQMIETRLRDISPIRQVATVVQVGTANYRKLVATSGFASGWVAETAQRPETTAPSFTEVSPPWGELYANPAATQAMLDDAVFDVESWLAGDISLEFAKQEGAAYISGNGTNRPKGFLAYPTAATGDATRAFGTLQYVAAGAAGNFDVTAPADKLIDLVHALRPAYRQGAVFLMNSATLARIRKFKDEEGNFLWRPSLAEGQPATLLGYPVIEAQDMPDVAADSFAIAFGNFAHGYVIAERTGTRILRDPYSNKPFVHFYATRRIGGAVVNSEAIKLMKFSAS